VLKALEDVSYDKWPFSRIGMSIMVIAKKNNKF
jgi:hypothetical protein